MDKIFKPKEIENKIYKNWEDQGLFKPVGKGPAFSMVIPPPNVTGILHMGHALNMTLQDTVVRYKRMQNFNTVWIPGTDHAGIATQNVVEKNLQQQNKSRFDLGRENFIDKVWDWKSEYGSRITSQIRKLGASVDWSKERFTMDQGCADAVKENFISLYNQKLIYRGSYIINWCTRCRTALSDIEVNHEDTKGSIWEIKYPYSDNEQESIIIATTRPETMFGDTAIAVHPDDHRYKNLDGKTVRIPCTNKHIPVIYDEHVDKDFGTGAVKVTPAHDINDFEIGLRHNLEQIKIMDEAGVMNNNVPEEFRKIDRYECRQKLIQSLQEKNYLLNTKDHSLAIGHCYRCNATIEPYLSNQWFVAMKKLAGPAIEAVKSHKITFTPKRWEKIYFDWMENIRDWCISRQIWWGHRIPVWYCNCSDEPVVSKESPDQCPKCQSSELTQDKDVLDTWFSSALWPFSTLGWPEQTKELKTYYPTSLLITAYDILTFWVSRMITIGLAQTKEIPFTSVYIHGLIRDSSGKKMSKSLGNAMDPLELIDEFGTDALRFSLASLSTMGGQDIKFSTEKIQACRNFANKIWNVSRYVLMILNEYEGKIDLDKVIIDDSHSHKWITSVFYSSLQEINKHYKTFNYALATELLWDFIWNNFCDWYIEISKIDKENALPVLVYLLVNIIKIMHPVMPFITEEIWQILLHSEKIDNLKSDHLITAQWPEEKTEAIDKTIEEEMNLIISIIRETRNLRKQVNIAPSKEINLILVASSKNQLSVLKRGKEYIYKLAKINKLDIMDRINEKPKQSSSSVLQNVQLFIPLEGLIDIKQEQDRLKKQLTKLEKELFQLNKKLLNQDFIKNAPDSVIEKNKNRQHNLNADKSLIEQQIRQLS
ncbi:MAG: valine--tRNA ligase [bacterium]|nr:valine--tRNA ligase [bacterium]